MKIMTSSQKGRKLSLTDVKLLIVALALAGTLGFWSVFARRTSSVSGSDLAAQNPGLASPPGAVTQSIALDLPPMPTLIPPAVGLAAGALPPKVLASTGKNQPSAGQAPVKIFLGGTKSASRMAPITITRSSR